MSRGWAGAHHVVLVSLLTLVGGAALMVAGTTSFTAPRQPIPLVWPISAVLVAGLFLLLDNGFMSQALAAPRSVLDRGLAVLVLVAFGSATHLVGELSDLPRLLQTWALALAALGIWTAIVRSVAAWIVVLGVGLMGVSAEFSTPWAPISRLFDGSDSIVVCAVTFALGCAVYVTLPSWWPVSRLARWSGRSQFG